MRNLLGAMGAFVVAKGLADESLVTEASGAIATISAIVWSLYEKTKRA